MSREIWQLAMIYYQIVIRAIDGPSYIIENFWYMVQFNNPKFPLVQSIWQIECLISLEFWITVPSSMRALISS